MELIQIWQGISGYFIILLGKGTDSVIFKESQNILIGMNPQGPLSLTVKCITKASTFIFAPKKSVRKARV